MAKITIDGILLEVPENKNILACALDSGIYIPHLCHHPDLNELGSCRLCIVEVAGETGVITSCTLKARDGLKIITKSERLIKLRSLALELLLAGHPEDCSTCPKYGNCELQTLIQYIGATTGRMRMRIKGFNCNENNPLFIHDMNRCVLCGRCVRACSELRGVNILNYYKKDLETYVGTLHNKLLNDVDCRFCGACAEVCPTGSIRDKNQMLSSNLRKEEAFVPCRAECPAHTDVPRYIRFVKEGKFAEANAVIREKAPFPAILGYICNHVCELKCKRNELNGALAIRNIKRFAAENDQLAIWQEKGKFLPESGKKVVIIGAGPAGLTSAYYLKKQGHSVTVIDQYPKAGGMMRYGIPSYRLPRHIIEKELSVIFEIGINFEPNTYVGNPQDFLEQGYDAVLLAIGSHQGIKLPIEGCNLDGVILNTNFLRDINLNKELKIGEKIVVLGGGNVAFDCARSAKRLGAQEIHLVCLEKRDNMLADQEEIIQGEEEGIIIHPACSFESINGINKVTSVTFSEIESFTFDENRQAVLVKKEASTFTIKADNVIFAIGQKPLICEKSGLEIGKGNTIKVTNNNLSTNISGIFAAGDAIYGTNSVIKAIASGREAATAIDKFLGGNGDISEVLAPQSTPDSFIGKKEGFGYLERKKAQIKATSLRSNNFELVDFGIVNEDICGEAERCLQCDLRLQISSPKLWGEFTSPNKEDTD